MLILRTLPFVTLMLFTLVSLHMPQHLQISSVFLRQLDGDITVSMSKYITMLHNDAVLTFKSVYGLAKHISVRQWYIIIIIYYFHRLESGHRVTLLLRSFLHLSLDLFQPQERKDTMEPPNLRKDHGRTR